MPTFIVKANREDDFYVLWSTVVDSPTGWGTKAEVKALLAFRGVDASEERFNRADVTGTSMNDPLIGIKDQWFGWEDKEFLLMEWDIPNRKKGGVYLLPRENLKAFCELGEREDPTHLLRFQPGPPATPTEPGKESA
jgi:hypothetical protein